MRRRSILKLAGLAGAAALIPCALRRARATTSAYEGPFFITVQAGWGWDPTLFCDPKGEPINETYASADIEKAGAIQYAPLPRNKSFFADHADRLLVLNGIELAAHQPSAGARQVWTGSTTPGYPCLGALLGAALGPDLPMSFLSTGGFEATGGVIPRSSIAGSDPGDWVAITSSAADQNTLFSPATEARIAQYRRERLAERIKSAHLPPVARALAAAQQAEMSRADVARWTEAFPPKFDNDEARSLAQLILSAFKAGVAVSANVCWSIKGGQFDAWQVDNFQDWMDKLDALFKVIDEFDLRSSVVIVAGSSGGRTPMYLEEKMKGSWSVTSMVLSGPGIPGNRVIGQTDEALRPARIDPKSLKPALDGVPLRPAHIHRALRKLAGVAGSALDERFPLPGEDLPLFD